MFLFFLQESPGAYLGAKCCMANLTVQELDESTVFTMKAVPGSSGPTRICGLLGGMLKIKVSAPPEKGKANQCLVRFIAHRLGVKKNAVSIITGTTSSLKRVQILGISSETLLKRLNLNERGLR